MTSNTFIVPIVPRWADIDLNQHMRHSAFADWAKPVVWNANMT